LSRKRALRLVLAEAGAHAAIEAQEITGKSINDLPEYFLSVFIARHVHQHFKTFTFSMEDTVKAICASEEIDEALISRPGKVDIVVRSQRTGNIRHIIELKRSYNIEGHIADIVRLAEFALAAPTGHPLERNFMVMMAAASESASDARWQRISELIKNQFNDKISLICTPILLEEGMLSTRKGRTNDKLLMGEVWEVKY
tara:strand:+ start:1263 stop:1859 length:597 start_codon:yes stop_codon:yes gene_type:complete